MAGVIAKSAVKAALGAVRATGKLGDVSMTADEVKEGVRLLYNSGAKSSIGKFLTGSDDAATRSVVNDVKYGYDEASYPRGAAKLPKGTLTNNKKAAMRTRQAALKNKKKGSKGGMR